MDSLYLELATASIHISSFGVFKEVKKLIYLEHGLIERGFDTPALHNFLRNIAAFGKQDKDVKSLLKYSSSTVLY